MQIVGFHWMRAAAKAGLFAAPGPGNMILAYRPASIGISGLLRFLDADHSPSLLHRILTDALGIVFGFGWEAVFVFVLLSGVSLGLSASARPGPGSWSRWQWRRAQRILLPYYAVAVMTAALMLALCLALARSHGPISASVHAKLGEIVGSSIPALAAAQVLLLNPFHPFTTGPFLAPAWWFVPAILLASLAFPLYRAALGRLGPAWFLSIGALISIASYSDFEHWKIEEFGWWFVVTGECFNFCLGIALGTWLSRPDARTRAAALLGGARLPLAGAALALLGNLFNLYALTYPVSSLLFTGGLAICGAAIALRLSRVPGIRLLLRTDSYHLYLVHQLLAFPMLVISIRIFHDYAVLAGLPVYICAAFLLTASFSSLYRALFRALSRS